MNHPALTIGASCAAGSIAAASADASSAGRWIVRVRVACDGKERDWGWLGGGKGRLLKTWITRTHVAGGGACTQPLPRRGSQAAAGVAALGIAGTEDR